MELKTIIYLLILLWVANKARFIITYFINRGKNLQKEKEARAKRDAKTYKFDKVDTKLKDLILSSNIQGLLDGQFQGKLTSKQIVTVFADRAYRIGRELNLTADECIDEALKLADEKDKQLNDCLAKKEDPYEKLGALHGIPFSVKDHLSLKGYLNTSGVGSRADYIDDRDSNYVKVFKEEGGIPLVKGNVPIICLSIHSYNRIWGCAQNPWNKERTCGGSSGGEAGILAANIAPCGLGSDLGGSLRVPAHFCGIYSFMPTGSRQSAHGIYNYFLHKSVSVNPMNFLVGPMTRNLDDLIRLMKLFYSTKLFDKESLLPRMLFNNQLYQDTLSSKKLRIGMIKEHETAIGMNPAVKRALDETCELLQKQGHEVIEVDIPNVEEHTSNHIKLMINEIATMITKNWKKCYDDLALLGPMIILYNCSPKIAKALSMLAKLVGQHRVSQVIEAAKRADNDGFTEIVQLRAKHMETVNDVWIKHDLDTLIVPPVPFPAFKSTDADDVGMTPIGARLAVYWQFPSGTLPITVVKENEDTFEEKLYNDLFTGFIKKTCKDSQGMPIGLEVVASPYKDEKALAVMKIIEEGTKFHEKHPYPKYE